MSDDPKSVWQNQQTEIPLITLNMLHRRVRQLKTKTRLQMAAHVALCIVEIACFGYAIQLTPQLWPFLLIAIVWSVTGLFLLNRDSPSGLNPGLTTGIDLYRNELERRQTRLRRSFTYLVGPAILAAGTFLFATTGGRFDLLLKTVPFVTLLAIWAVLILFVRRKERRQLEKELNEPNQDTST